MTKRTTDELIAMLAADAAPVERLASPTTLAMGTLLTVGMVGVLALLAFPTLDPLALRGEGGSLQAGLETLGVLVTGILAVLAAFHLAIPGHPRWWALVPLPALAFWIGVSGLGCWHDMLQTGRLDRSIDHSLECLVFIIGASLVAGPIIAWRLSRADPIDPTSVAALGGLGSAAISAFFLQFFHQTSMTFIDLAIHIIAVGLVTLAAVTMRKIILRPR